MRMQLPGIESGLACRELDLLAQLVRVDGPAARLAGARLHGAEERRRLRYAELAPAIEPTLKERREQRGVEARRPVSGLPGHDPHVPLAEVDVAQLERADLADAHAGVV